MVKFLVKTDPEDTIAVDVFEEEVEFKFTSAALATDASVNESEIKKRVVIFFIFVLLVNNKNQT
jgi:hypothetical protein